MAVTLKYVTRDRDRHGNIRLYYRKDGRKIRLRGPEGSPEFLEDYRLACLGHLEPKASTKSTNTRPIETLRDLVEQYYRSAAYLGLDLRTRRVRRQILDRFCETNRDGDKPYRLLEPKHLIARRDAMFDRPEAANGMLKALRQVFECAISYGLHDRNPAKLVPYLHNHSQGHLAWEDEQIVAYERTHPLGTMARLAMSLALFTGQRKGDLIRLGPKHIRVRNGVEGLHFTQQKNRKRNPVDLWVPILPELRAILDLSPTGPDTFIQTEFGRPFSEGGFGNRFRKWCNEAGLVGFSVHGLRKTASAVLAENGCTEQEIMAITGHSTSKEVIRYTRSAQQHLRAINAMRKHSRASVTNPISKIEQEDNE
jgi:integrase